MVLGNRRRRIVFVALAGMDIAVLLPYVLTWISLARIWNQFSLPSFATGILAHPYALFGICWATMISYMVVVDLLNRGQFDSPRREVFLFLMVIGTSLVGIRLFLYPISDCVDFSWVRDTALSIFNFSDGVLPPLLLILVNTFLWIRVAMAMDREIGFFGVGVSFRLGLLLSLLGGALLSTIGNQPASTSLLYFVIFFALSLLAVAVTRIDEKAVGVASSSGSLVPYLRLAEIGAFILVIIFTSFTLQNLLAPGTIRRSMSLLDPLWRVIGWLLTTVLLAIFLVIGPAIDRLMIMIQNRFADAEPLQQSVEPMAPADYFAIETIVREWTVLRYCLVIAFIIAVLAILWFFFVKPDDSNKVEEVDEDVPEESSSGIRPGLPTFERLRDWLSMLRKFGVSQGLLSAVSVENMYANLGRLARSRGYPRLPSQPPDKYLPTLQEAFPEQEQCLLRITQAYMQVHYGDLPIEEDELTLLRADYSVIIASPPTVSHE